MSLQKRRSGFEIHNDLLEGISWSSSFCWIDSGLLCLFVFCFFAEAWKKLGNFNEQRRDATFTQIPNALLLALKRNIYSPQVFDCDFGCHPVSKAARIRTSCYISTIRCSRWKRNQWKVQSWFCLLFGYWPGCAEWLSDSVTLGIWKFIKPGLVNNGHFSRCLKILILVALFSCEVWKRLHIPVSL